MVSAEITRLTCKIAGLAKHRPADDPALVAARAELAALTRRSRARQALAELTASERAEILEGYGPRRKARR